MSSHHIVGNLKKLLMCTKRQNTVRNNTASMCSSTDHSKEATSESMMCQPRITLQELIRRRQLPRRVSLEPWTGKDDTESPKTLSCTSLSIDNYAAQTPQQRQQIIHAPPAHKPQSETTCANDRTVATTISSTMTSDKPQHAVRLQQCSCQAEICVLDTCDHRCMVDENIEVSFAVVRLSDLVVTDYLPPESLSAMQNPKAMNDVRLCNQFQLNAELDEVNCHRSNGSSIKFSEHGIHVRTAASNQAMFLPISCNSTQQNACHSSAHRGQKMLDMSEPGSVCASLKSRDDQNIRCPTCWPNGDTPTAAETAISPSVEVNAAVNAKASTHMTEGEKLPDSFETTNVIAQTNDHADNTSNHTHQMLCQMCRTALSRGSISASKVSRDRLGVLSTELCVNLGEVATGADLVQRYLEKRKVCEATRTRHEQRYGRIREDLLPIILTVNASAALDSGNYPEESGRTFRSTATPATTAYVDLFWSGSQFNDATTAAACSTIAVQTKSSVELGPPEPGPKARSPQEKRKARTIELSTNCFGMLAVN